LEATGPSADGRRIATRSRRERERADERGRPARGAPENVFCTKMGLTRHRFASTTTRGGHRVSLPGTPGHVTGGDLALLPVPSRSASEAAHCLLEGARSAALFGEGGARPGGAARLSPTRPTRA